MTIPNRILVTLHAIEDGADTAPTKTMKRLVKRFENQCAHAGICPTATLAAAYGPTGLTPVAA